MTNVTEPAIRRVIQPIVRSVGESRDKEYGMKIIDAKFRPTGAIDSRPTGGTLEGRLTSPSAPARLSTGRRCRRHDKVAERPRRPRYRQYGRGHGEEYRAHFGARGRGRRPEPRDEPADLGGEQPPPRESGRSARLTSHLRASQHRKGGRRTEDVHPGRTGTRAR